MTMKSMMVVWGFSLALATVAGEVTIMEANGKVVDTGRCEIAKVDSGTDSGKSAYLEFEVKCPADGKYGFVVSKLPPHNYFVHVNGFVAGKHHIDEYARGVELELSAGVSKIRIDKRGGRAIKAKDRFFWGKCLVQVKSTLDGTSQPCYFWAPERAKTESVPLVVGLHTWSGDYFQLDHYIGVRNEAERRGWVFVGPNFRGPNSTPPACGGDPAVQDIVDAIDYAKARVKVDAKRVYIIGGSGGGHMTLLMLGRHPEVFAAGAAFCPITDLARWHADSLLEHPGRGKSYATMMEGACGGAPAGREREYAHRSPLTWLGRAKAAGVPAYICTGIHDGWTGSVPVGHSFRAFNALCADADIISEADIAAVEATQSIPVTLKSESANDPFYSGKGKIHFRRTSNLARLTIFEGGHGGNFQAGFDFLSRQAKGQSPDWTIAKSGKGGEEKLAK